MEETFSQIEGAAAHSVADVNVSISSGGSVVGQGVTASAGAIRICGGNLDSILRSFGGIEGAGNMTIGGKSASVVRKASKRGGMIANHLDSELSTAHDVADRFDHVASLAADAREAVGECDASQTFSQIQSYATESASKIRQIAEGGLAEAKQGAGEFLQQGGQFLAAIDKLGGRESLPAYAGGMSMAMSSVNNLRSVASNAQRAMGTMASVQGSVFGTAMRTLNAELEQRLNRLHLDQEQVQTFLTVWRTLMAQAAPRGGNVDGGEMEGGDVDGGDVDGGDTEGGRATANQLATRLNKARQEMKNMINKFIDAFGRDVNGLVDDTTSLAKHLGKDIDYSDNTVVFLDTFDRIKEFLTNPQSTRGLYQHFLELNLDQVDSKEIKDRFLSNMRDLADRAETVGSHPTTKAFSKRCHDIIATINKYNDMIKTHRDAMKGGSTDDMNELFSLDTSRIDIVGFLNPLENLALAIKKLKFYRDLAVFRGNLAKTSTELATYSKDYSKSVGQAIGDAITRIKVEYDEITRQIDDNKAGMGLEIDMYNTARASDAEKISKEKLKLMYKWQCDARTGLYKTVEAIDLYLYHFTDAIAKNPDAVADLQKLLSATRIIAKWYDAKAGDNLIRFFESFRDIPAGTTLQQLDEQLNAPDFVTATYQADGIYADLTRKVGGDRAARIYERSRRAVEGVVVLKNIISYFVTIGEKYGNLKSEKNIIMAPSNIYKNLVNYIWVSALDMNIGGTELLTENNEIKRVVSVEDTKVMVAQVTNIDPDTYGINFNRHSMDKLRILKSFNDLNHLRNFTDRFTNDDLSRVKQFVNSIFNRLGKTKYIFEMFKFGVYDFTLMEADLIEEYLLYMDQLVAGAGTIDIDINGAGPVPVNPANANALATAIAGINAPDRSDQITLVFNTAGGIINGMFVSLKQFLTFTTQDYVFICSMITDPAFDANTTFMSGFLSALTLNDDSTYEVLLAQRSVAALNYCISNMLRTYQRDHGNSAFAIDDTYFVLTIKAVAGKIMAITGVNRMFKDPNAYSNTIIKNPTRMIMGGASGESDVIEGAVELYVRLPLLVEFYRSIFDDGNKVYKQESPNGHLDEERISYVPEVGNIWTNLIVNIFDKAKHIESGLYTVENMNKIVAEVNAIYKHFKGSVPDEQLTRHVMTELVAEINRRYGVIKRQELLNYYRAVNATKRNTFDVVESNYTNNDLDILNEAEEFEEKSPSDEFIKFKESITKAPTAEAKVNKLTDYKILKEFRNRIRGVLDDTQHDIRVGNAQNGAVLSMVERIRQLKASIKAQPSNSDKYAMIIKAIEESESMNQSANDIYACFHEFVIMPLRTAYQMYYTLDRFLRAMASFTVVSTTVSPGVAEFDAIRANPILTSQINGTPFLDLVNAEVIATSSVDKISRGAAGNYESLFNLRTDPFAFTNVGGLAGANRLSCNDANAGNGIIQSRLMRVLQQFTSNAGDLVKLNISMTDRITVDLSEYQKLCEYLIANVKYMVDKFTGLVPAELLVLATNPTQEGGVYWLEQELVTKIFNKLNKSEANREIISIDTLNKIMPVVSQIIFKTPYTSEQVLRNYVLEPGQGNFNTGVRNALPIIRDSFKQYTAASRAFTLSRDSYISSLLFNPMANTATLATSRNSGVLYAFNSLLSQYLNDLYDAQSQKIYTKAFETFAGNALTDAMNGQSFPDFNNAPVGPNTAHYDLPQSQTILSSTLAYTMKIMINRVHPTTGAKIHELTSLQDVAPHTMERYRALLPMYIRSFTALIKRCRVLRKMIARLDIGNFNAAPPGAPGMRIRTINGANGPNTLYRELGTDTVTEFATNFNTLLVNGTNIKDITTLYIDEIVNATTSLLQDIQNVQKELLETDTTVSLYFDIKKDFTKNYFTSSKELPFAPLSILAMGFGGANTTFPLHGRDIIANKYLYGLRSLIADNFKITSTKVPYLKKLLNDFNGYTVKGNQITESKFNDVLSYIGQAMNYMYDLRFFNGRALAQPDMLSNIQRSYPMVLGARHLRTFQEMNTSAASMTLIESVNVIDSRNKIADYTKSINNPLPPPGMVVAPLAPGVITNPRRRVIMVNIVDMNIMPINVHSLMREIPLANLYNYAMTFDETITTLNISAQLRQILLNPYQPIGANMSAGPASTHTLTVNGADVPTDDIQGNNALRFVGDMLVRKLMKAPRRIDVVAVPANPRAGITQRTNSKIFHNLLFLTTVQYAIKTKVKTELEFINTRVVSSNNAVSRTITNAIGELGETVDDNLFQF